MTGTDTTFYTACSGADKPAGTPFTYTTAIGPRSIRFIPDSTVGKEQAGDPYQARTMVFARAIDYLDARFPNSTAGAIAFEGDTNHVRPLLALSMPGDPERVKASLVLDSGRQSFYGPPLYLATDWLNDTALSHAARKAIVFITEASPLMHPRSHPG